MDELGCDYSCRTVGESITKYNIPGDWCAEFDAYDGVYPIIVIPAEQVRKSTAMMDVKLSIIENPDEEYAGCMVIAEKKTIAFKVDRMGDLQTAMEKM